jgi:hypothetical protein
MLLNVVLTTVTTLELVGNINIANINLYVVTMGQLQLVIN